MIRWLYQVGLALTRLGNALLGGLAEESMSSRAWRMESARKPWGRIARPLVDLFFTAFGRHEHCFSAYINERDKAPLPNVKR
jgi:hypothetical protein